MLLVNVTYIFEKITFSCFPKVAYIKNSQKFSRNRKKKKWVEQVASRERQESIFTIKANIRDVFETFAEKNQYFKCLLSHLPNSLHWAKKWLYIENKCGNLCMSWYSKSFFFRLGFERSIPKHVFYCLICVLGADLVWFQ